LGPSAVPVVHATPFAVKRVKGAADVDHLIRIQNGTRAPSSIVAIRLVDALDLNPDYGLGADLIRYSVAGVGHDPMVTPVPTDFRSHTKRGMNE